MTTPAIAPYTMRGLQHMLGLSRGVISRLIEARYVSPGRGHRNEYRFSFQDVVLLRTAHELRTARVPHRRLLRSLQRLRESLPGEMPLSGLRIKAVGDRVAVLEPGAAWDPHSGQLLLDLEVAPTGPPTAVLVFRTAAPEPTASECCRRARALETQDAAAAEAAYRRALELDPRFVPGYVDLGAMLCNAGRCQEAMALYEEALRLAPADPSVHFNAAIALEDQGRHADALAHYEAALRLDPALSDAHFNAARLCEGLGDPQGALRHYSAYRRLERLAGQPEPETP